MAEKLSDAKKIYDLVSDSNRNRKGEGTRGDIRAQVRFNNAEREKNKVEYAFEQQHFKVDRLKKELLAKSNE